jgi:hypothetical protein
MAANNIQFTFPWGMILFLIFMTLKLTGHITWSWWWVTAPLWIPAVFFLGILAAVFVGAVVIALVGK